MSGRLANPAVGPGARHGLSARGLEKSFGAQAVLRGVDLDVPEGSLTAILGPSGSGKTTLLRIVAGFERADAGTVHIGGTLVEGTHESLAPERRHIGYVPQEGALFPHLSVGRNVLFGLPKSRRSPGQLEALLEMVGMAGYAGRAPHQLSGGQQQRVALARALAVEPALVLLDEPFSSLDPALRTSVRADVAQVLRKAGTTAVLVTHDQGEALSWADHVAVLREGRIRQLDVPQRLYGRPADPELARFLGEANLVPGTLSGHHRVDTAFGRLELVGEAPAGQGQPVEVLIRPEQLQLVEAPGPAESEWSVGDLRRVDGTVVDFQYFGHDAVLRLRPDPGTGLVPLVVRAVGPQGWEVGQRAGMVVRGPVVVWPRDRTTRV